MQLGSLCDVWIIVFLGHRSSFTGLLILSASTLDVADRIKIQVRKSKRNEDILVIFLLAQQIN